MAFHRCKIIFRDLKSISQGCKAILKPKNGISQAQSRFRNLKGTSRG